MSFSQRHHYQQQPPPSGKEKVTRLLSAGQPDRTVHHVPGVMTLLGGLGVVAGITANGWQMFTTMTALYQMFTGNASLPSLNLSNITVDICLFIAFSFQLALLFLVFRIDTRWKRQQTGASSAKKRRGATRGYGFAAVEVVQHLGLFAVWVGLAFVVDTLGDYSFIASRTTYADPASSAFLIFLYAVALYALSTLAFVRSIEYLWVAAAVQEQWEDRREERRLARRGPVKY